MQMKYKVNVFAPDKFEQLEQHLFAVLNSDGYQIILQAMNGDIKDKEEKVMNFIIDIGEVELKTMLIDALLTANDIKSNKMMLNTFIQNEFNMIKEKEVDLDDTKSMDIQNIALMIMSHIKLNKNNLKCSGSKINQQNRSNIILPTRISIDDDIGINLL